MKKVRIRGRRLSEKNKILTPDSDATIFINYSYDRHILEAQFKQNNKVYHYKKVGPELWEEYKSVVQVGDSSGIFINTRIKPFYEFEAIE